MISDRQRPTWSSIQERTDGAVAPRLSRVRRLAREPMPVFQSPGNLLTKGVAGLLDIVSARVALGTAASGCGRITRFVNGTSSAYRESQPTDRLGVIGLDEIRCAQRILRSSCLTALARGRPRRAPHLAYQKAKPSDAKRGRRARKTCRRDRPPITVAKIVTKELKRRHSLLRPNHTPRGTMRLWSREHAKRAADGRLTGRWMR